MELCTKAIIPKMSLVGIQKRWINTPSDSKPINTAILDSRMINLRCLKG